MADEFILGAYWKYRKRTMGEYISDLKLCFSELQKVTPAFSHLFYRSKSLPGFQAAVMPDLSNLRKLLLEDRDFDSRDFDHADANGRPTLDSVPKIGFITSFWDGNAAVKGGIEMLISAGISHERLTNSLVIGFPYEEFGDYWLHLDRLYPLLEAVIRVWRPAHALVTSHAFRDKVKTDLKKKATIGWLNYFADSSVADGLPPEVKYKTLETGGVILQLTDERISAQNADQVALAREVQNVLGARGLLDKERIFSYTLENADARH